MSRAICSISHVKCVYETKINIHISLDYDKTWRALIGCCSVRVVAALNVPIQMINMQLKHAVINKNFGMAHMPSKYMRTETFGPPPTTLPCHRFRAAIDCTVSH